MDTPQSNALLKKLIAAVERVGHYLEMFRQDLNQRANAIRGSYERHQEENREQKREPVTIKFTDEEVHHRKAAQSEANSIQKSIRNATRGAVVVAAVYATLTYCLFVALQKQTRMRREGTIETERAWIGIDGGIVSAPVTYPYGPNPVFKLQYTLKNVGRSAAHVTVYGKIFDLKFGKWRDVQDDFCQPKLDDAKQVGRRWGKGAYTIIPGNELPFNLSYDGA